MMAVRRLNVRSVFMRAMASELCWRIVLIFFVLEATWIACSAAYPMAFDEQFHFGLIQLHAKQWLPFFTSQPSTGVYGAAVRDPSYLYHWLMSFPYRGISLISHNQTTQIICLRIINVAMVTVALVLYRRLFRKLRLSETFINCSLLALILIPVVPFLAATINYDNLVMVAMPLTILLTFHVLDTLRAGHIPLASIMLLGSTLLLGSLVKYPFLTVLAVTVLFLLWYMWRHKLFTLVKWRESWRGFRALPTYKYILLIILLVLSLGLFSERYAVNMVRYHAPLPACAQVVSRDTCQQYGPWARDDQLEQAKDGSFQQNPLWYSLNWLWGMWYRLFFAIGPYPTYDTQPPLYVISRLAIVVAILGVLGVIIRFKSVVFGHLERTLLLLLILGYGITLFEDNYIDYVHTAAVVAVNGRYWIPFLTLFLALAGFAWSSILRRMPNAKITAASLVLVPFVLLGGGAMTFIARSNDSWYWPNSTIRRINTDIRSAVHPILRN